MSRETGMMHGLLAVALVSVLALSSCGASTPPEEGDAAIRRHGGLVFGVFLPEDDAPSSQLRTVAQMAGRTPDLVMVFAAIGDPVPVERLVELSDSGITPVLTLEPWVPEAGPHQPRFTPARIAAGEHDAALRRWAGALAELDRPLMLRFAHEMNGDWYPWSAGINGSSPEDYVAAWNHLHELVRSAGAHQVSFVWSPNVPEDAAEFENLYPGPQTVDVLGLDGYNWGDSGGHRWLDPPELFDDGLTALRRLPGDQPILITETASAEGLRSGEDKARWIRELVRYLRGEDRVAGFIWFQAQKERDWRFNSTAEAQEALREALQADAAG